jgi:hypothetical protein
VARNYAVHTINQNRIDKSKFLDAGGDLLDLLLGVGARVFSPRTDSCK